MRGRVCAGLAALGTSVVLASCGGGGNGAPAPLGPTVSASSLTFAGNPSIAPQSVTASGFQASISARAGDPRIVDIAPAKITGSSGRFTITAIAGGTTTLIVSDGMSTVTIPVTVIVCLPPVPALRQAVPADKQSGVAVNVFRIVFSLVSSDPQGSIATQYQARLLGSNATVITGSILARTQPPPGAPPEMIVVTTWYASTVPQLVAGTTYQVQLFNHNLACVPPFITGTFST